MLGWFAFISYITYGDRSLLFRFSDLAAGVREYAPGADEHHPASLDRVALAAAYRRSQRA
jgi:hypothetical protein